MLSNPRLRWALLLSLLGLTLVAVVFPVDERGRVIAVEQALPRRVAAPLVALDASLNPAMSPAESAAVGSDPFAPRGWTAPAPTLAAPSVPAAASLTVAPVELTQPGPPELPFRYVGSLVDGGDQTVYVARGDQAYVLRSGDVVDATYEVLGITQTQIEFEHIPTGAKQALIFPIREN